MLIHTQKRIAWIFSSSHILHLHHIVFYNLVRNYEECACSAVVPGSGTNKEFALHLLHFYKGDIKVSWTSFCLNIKVFFLNMNTKMISAIFFKIQRIFFFEMLIWKQIWMVLYNFVLFFGGDLLQNEFG